MNAERVDVAIVGGGPAGCACAAELARLGRGAAVIERDDGEAPRVGDNVGAAARPLLAELGIDLDRADRAMPCALMRSAWGRDALDDEHAVFNALGHGWHVDRSWFDGRVAAAAEARGARVRRGEDVIEVEGPDPWRLIVDGRGGRRLIEADFVVDATGRRAWLGRRHGGVRRRYDRLCAAAWWLDAPLEPWALVEGTAAGWWYSAPLPGARSTVMFLTDAELHDVLLPPAPPPHTAARLAGVALPGRPRMTNACSQWVEAPAGARWLPVGDAALAVDPLSARGITFALRSGRDAARAVDGFLGGDAAALARHNAAIAGELDAYLLARHEVYGQERRWPDAPFWTRR